MDYIKAIRNAIQDANSLKSGIADWSYLCDMNEACLSTKYMDVYMDAKIHAYDNYKQSIWGATYMNLLGKHIMSNMDHKANILELGSAECMTIQNMTKGVQKSMFEYISIDRATDSNCFGSKHIKADVFDVSDALELSDDYRFDILILDVEPHGKEIEIYKKFAKYGATHHVVILKCVGFIDLYGAYYADHFLNHLKNTNRLVDYFGIVENNYFTRDVTVVVSREPNPDAYVGELACFVKESGGELKSRSNSQTPSMVCWCSKEYMKNVGHPLHNEKLERLFHDHNQGVRPLATQNHIKKISAH